MNDRVVLHGIGVSSGTAHGLAVRITPAAGVDTNEPACTDVEADGQRVRDAFSQVAEGLAARAEKAPEASKAILTATAGLARDKALVKGVDKQLKKGMGVTAAVHEAVEVYAGKLRKIGGYMAERVTDLYDIRDRTIARLRGLPEPGVPESFKVLIKEMQSLCLNVEVLSTDGTTIEMRDSDDAVFTAAEELGIDLSRAEPSSVEEV